MWIHRFSISLLLVEGGGACCPLPHQTVGDAEAIQVCQQISGVHDHHKMYRELVSNCVNAASRTDFLGPAHF